MDYDERETRPADYYGGERAWIDCDSCYNTLNEFEQDDPCEIDGRMMCDKCASVYIYFRSGTLRNVADMTAELVLEEEIRLARVSDKTHKMKMELVSMPDFAARLFGFDTNNRY